MIRIQEGQDALRLRPQLKSLIQVRPLAPGSAMYQVSVGDPKEYWVIDPKTGLPCKVEEPDPPIYIR